MSEYNNINNTDHRAILEKLTSSDSRQEQILSHLESIRQDMKDLMIQNRDDSRKDRDMFRKELSDVHERINDVKSLSEKTSVQLNSTTDELTKVRTNLGRVTMALVCSVVGAIVAGFFSINT